MNYKLIKVEEKYSGQVFKISLNSPPANILSCQAMNEISEAFAAIEKNSKVKMVILSGEGAHFSYGASVEEHLPEKVEGMLPQFHKFIGQVLNSHVPTLGQVSGMCLGGGFELALACSLIFMDESTKCGVPEIQLGVFPPVAAALLPLLTNGPIGARMLLAGGRFSAKDLFQAGLCNQVSAPGQIESDVSAFVEKEILPKSGSSLRFAHRAARQVICSQYEAHIGALEKLYLKDLMASHDAKEGIKSFVEKRPAQWKDF